MKKFLIAFFAVSLLVALAFPTTTYAANEIVVDAKVTITATDEGLAFVDYKIDLDVISGSIADLTVQLPNSDYRFNYAEGDITHVDHNNSSLKLYFGRSFQSGESIKVYFSLWQSKIGQQQGNDISYEFTPLWIKDYVMSSIRIEWQTNSSVATAINNTSTDGDTLIWERDNIQPGQKVVVKVEYIDMAYAANQEYLRVSQAWIITGVIASAFILVILSTKFIVPFFMKRLEGVNDVKVEIFKLRITIVDDFGNRMVIKPFKITETIHNEVT